tara:strand:- start:2327 stop:2923 length:597 start_codon:yes stop_codon:yes gene_type:complete
MIHNTHRIVLTGGPGGGKTTAADLIRRELGEKIVVVPEAATMLFSGGFPRADLCDQKAEIAAQKAIFHVQQNIEDVVHAMYPGRVLLCDRGTVDGAAYWPNGNGEDFFQAMHTSHEGELSRYDAVIFFETAAKGGISIEMGNPIRNEDNLRAVELDKKLQSYWSKHKNFVFVKHQTSFIKKLQCAIQALEKTIEKLNQ